MLEPLSQQLAELSVRAKNAEDAMAAAQQEAHDKIDQRRAQAHAAATAAMEKVNQAFKSIGDTASAKWSTLQAKVAADMDGLKAGIAQFKHDQDARRAEENAEWLEGEATLAIDYAVASVEQARLAVLDAVASRMEAEEAKRA